VHLVLGLLFVRLLTFGFDMTQNRKPKSEAVKTERIGFLTLPRNGSPNDLPGKDGGDGRPTSKTPAPSPVRAPSVTPTTLPPVPTGAAPAPSGSGEQIGKGGPTQGIRPSYTGDRLYAPPSDVVSAPKSSMERLDSSMVANFRPFADSLDSLHALHANDRKPGDWTVKGKNGERWGMDQTAIRLGKFSIPNALLALLPMNAQKAMQGNPTEIARERWLSQIHSEIAEHSQRALNEDEFRRAAAAIRLRKDRERAKLRGENPDKTVVSSP
jgi:hypothetical protein